MVAPKPTSPEPEGFCERPPQAGFKVGHPIIPATGEKVLTHSDYEGQGPHALSLVRSFRSSRVVGALTGAATAGLGQTWSHNQAVSLKQEGATGTAGSSIKVLLGDGSIRTFSWDVATGRWKASNSADTLTPGAAGLLYKRLDDDSSWQFDTAGKLLTVTQRNGWITSYTYGNASAPGQLTQVTNQFGQSLAFAYNAAGQLTSVSHPDGQTSSYSHDSAGRLSAVTQPGGAGGTVSKTYLYENAQFPQLLTGIIDETGNRLATYAYDSQGRGILTEHAGGADRHTIGYGASAGAPVTVTDPLGTQRTYNYSTSLGKLAVTAASLPSSSGAGDAASRVQDANGFVTQETDFLGVSTMYTWDINRRLPLSSTQAAGRPEAQTTSTQWHPAFRLPVLVSEAGRSTAYTYDSLGNKLTETLTDTATGQTRAWAWTYNAQGLASSQTAPNGGVSQYGYDAQGKLTSVTNPQGHVTQLAYDTAGRLAQQTAPNGLLSSYSYDARGWLLMQMRGGEASRYSYTSSGQLASASLPNGYQVSYHYDAAQRLTGATDNRGNSVQYTLDAMGNRVREEVKDANGNIALATSRVINSLNRIAAIQGATGQTTALAFDANGESTSATDPLNQTTRQTLDALRRPVTTTLADNTAASQAWNALNQLAQATDPKGIATRYQRNAFGEVMAETSPDIGSISYQRNAAGQVIGQTDAKGNTRQITRDALGRPTEIRHSANHITRYLWDQGQVGYLSKTEDNSGSTSYERDPWGRITGKSQTVNDNPNSPSSFTTRYSYQGGELAGISYPSGLKVIYRRSASGQISGIETQEPYSNPKRPSLLSPFLSNLSYTALGQPKAWRWSNGAAASRVFDADGRMASNEFASYNFDAASRITGITQNLWASRTVTGGASTGTATLTELYQTPLSWSASYDNRNRLTGFNRAGTETRYSYDANSNRLTAIDKTTSDTDLDGGFDADDFSNTSSQALNIEGSSNKLLGFSQTHSKTKGSQTLATTSSNVSYSLDANGNLTNDGLRTFDYDETNRLAKVKLLQDGEEAAIRYLHNALGQRVFKGEPQAESYQPNEAELGQDFIGWLKKNFQWLFAQAQANSSLGTAYVYGDEQLPEWAVLGDYDNGSATGKGRTEYIWLPTEGAQDPTAIPVGMYRNGKFFAIHTDHLGTPRLITNEQNKPVWQWPYSAFGNNKPTGVLKATANPKQAMTNQPVLLRATNPAAEFDLRFPGQIADSETGQFYNYFRSYDPGKGRYTQNDPIGLDGGWNRFSYVGANSLGGIDPLGLDTVVVVGGGTSGNPFGHAAIGFTGQGIYSYGTGTPIGGSVTDYLVSQAIYRDSTVYILKTNTEQEAKMRNEILKYRGIPLPNPLKAPWGAAQDTCATRTQNALEAGGVTSIFAPFTSPFPTYTGGVAARNAATTVVIPKGGAIPGNFSSFNK